MTQAIAFYRYVMTGGWQAYMTALRSSMLGDPDQHRERLDMLLQGAALGLSRYLSNPQGARPRQGVTRQVEKLLKGPPPVGGVRPAMVEITAQMFHAACFDRVEGAEVAPHHAGLAPSLVRETLLDAASVEFADLADADAVRDALAMHLADA